MKIAIDARSYSTSTGRYIRKLIEYLEKLRSDHEFVILLKSKDFDTYQPKAKNFSKLRANFKEFTFAEQVAFNRFLKKQRFDLVHFGMVQQPVLYRGRKVTTMHDLTTCRFNNSLKNPFVINFKRQIYKWVNKKVARDSNHIITPSRFVRGDVAEFAHIKQSRITVTYESADPINAKIEPIKQLEKSQFIFYVGQSTPHKNLSRLVDGFALIQEKYPDMKLVLAGKKDGMYSKLLYHVDEQGIKNVVVPGFVSEGQLRWLYQNCAVYVFPSLSEGFGLPGLEAMTESAPVVSSNATCLPEIYGEAAHYFDPYDKQDIASKITEVLSDKKLRTTLIKEGAKCVGSYSWEKMAKQTLGVYEKTLSKS